MKRLVFAGCSFTHSGDSWAYSSRPLIFDTDELIPANYNLHVRREYMASNFSLNIVQSQHRKYLHKYGTELELLNPETFWNDSHPLPWDEYEINIFGMGSNSNTNTARAVMHFIENYSHTIDTVVFQISGFARRELYTSDKMVINNAKILGTEHNVSSFDDVTFIKHWGAIDYNEVTKEDNPDYFRKSAALFYSKIFEPEEYHIRAIESLQSLTNFCIANNIKFGYFHGWDNYPKSEWDYDDQKRDNDTRNFPSKYFEKKYNKYVKPYLLSNDSIISYAESNLPQTLVYDIMSNGEHGGHPCPVAHKLFWNNIVYPFVK